MVGLILAVTAFLVWFALFMGGRDMPWQLWALLWAPIAVSLLGLSILILHIATLGRRRVEVF